MANEKNVEFDLWDFIERYHPQNENYPHQQEMQEIRDFLCDKRLMDSVEGSKVVCKILGKYGSRYGALAHLQMLTSRLYLDAYAEYFVQQNL